MSTLIIAAHPDDEVLGAGGWMAKYPGCKVAFVSEGVSARPVTEVASVRISYEEKVAARQQAAKNAAAVLQAEIVYVGDYVDQMLAITNRALHWDVANLIRAHAPTTVLTHHPHDLNADHRVVAEVVAVACRAFTVQGQRIRSLLGFAVDAWAVPTAALQYDSFCALSTAEMTRKLEAIEAYADELRPWPHPRNQRAIEAHHRWLGAISGSEYAEPYRLFWGRL